jgi:D-alanine-D-alanine ligase
MSPSPDESATRALKVVVLAGGRSSEHDVSLSSAAAVRAGLHDAGHRVIWVEIGRDGVWRSDGEPLSVTPAGGLLDADVVFPVLHGPFGEDGTVQGMLETLDVAYVGAGVAASAVCLDKILFKELMSTVGLPQVEYRGVRAERFAAAPEEVLAALEQGFVHDGRVIVEAMATGVEVECGVLGRSDHETDADGGETALASEPGEIVLSGEWYDYEAKYTPGGMELRVPAGISASARERVRQLAVGAFLASGCEGLARVDFFVAGEQVLVNELNTMPGFTPTSVYAKLLAATGVSYSSLVERLCLLALERHERRRAHSL